MELAELIIKESANEGGTWTYRFLTDVNAQTGGLKQHEFDKLISRLFSYIMENTTPNLQRFKIAQLLSSLKMQNPFLSEEIFGKHRENVEKLIASLDSSKYGDATKRQLHNIYGSTELCQRYKSEHGSPRIVPAAAISGCKKSSHKE